MFLLIPKQKNIKLKDLNSTIQTVCKNNSISNERPSDSPFQGTNTTGDYISIWNNSFQSIDSNLSSEVDQLNLANLKTDSKNLEANERDQYCHRIGNIYLIQTQPLLKETLNNFNLLNSLLENLDPSSIALLEKLKSTVGEKEPQSFCENCGKDTPSSFFGMFVRLNSFRNLNADYVATLVVKTV